MSNEEAMFEQARLAVQKRETERARDLLTRLLKANPNHAEYWLWMSAAVETRREVIYCLKEAHRLDPKNEIAERGLILHGELPLNKKYIVPFSKQKRKWSVKLPGEEVESIRISPKTLAQLPLVVVGIILLAIFLVIGIFGAGSVPPFLRFLWPSPTSAIGYGSVPTFSREVIYTPTFTRLTPLSAALKATYTPTPLAVRTQHASNDFRDAMQAYRQGDWVLAEENLRKAIAGEPNSADLYYYLGEVGRFQHKYADALEAYLKAEELNPDFAAAYLGYGRAILSSNPAAWQKARAEFAKAVSIDPKLAEGYLELAAVDLQQGDALQAMQDLEPAETLLPNSPLFYLYRAQAHLALGEAQAALLDARKANELDFTLMPVYRLLGQIYLEIGEAENAVAPLVTYTLYYPEDVQALTWLARSYEGEGKTDLAIAAINQAIQLDNRWIEAYLLREEIYFAAGRFDLARNDALAVVNLDPAAFAGRIALARCMIELKQYNEAINQLTIAESYARVDAELAQVYYWRAMCYEKLEHPVNAYNDWVSLSQLPPGSVPQEWEKQAVERMSSLASPTFTPPTPTSTSTRQPTRTLRPTSTRQPTRTQTSTPTPKPTK